MDRSDGNTSVQIDDRQGRTKLRTVITLPHIALLLAACALVVADVSQILRKLWGPTSGL